MPNANSSATASRPSWSPGRIALWTAALLASGLLFGPSFISSFRPPTGMASDFLQEWLSAKDYWAVRPIYSPLDESLYVHTGERADRPLLAWNAHPPVSVLFVLPFGWTDYPTAHLVWNLLTFPLFLLSAVVVVRELRVPLRPLSLLPTIALTLACFPLYYQVSQGQWNCALAFLVVASWLADRRGYTGWAGFALGLAAAIKFFPAFCFLYFACTGRFRAIAVGGITVVLLHAVAYVAFGEAALSTYIRDVIPSVANYRNQWQNLSLEGFGSRLFGAPGNEKIVALLDFPELTPLVVLALRVLLVAVVGRICWYSRGCSNRDRAFAITAVAMLLASPVTWSHYLLLATLPLAFAWMRLPAGPIRCFFSFAMVIFWLPNTYLVSFAVGKPQAELMMYGQHNPLPPIVNLTVVSLPFYALLTLFALIWYNHGEPDSPKQP